MSVLNTQEIMEILPHRSPFLLIDTVEELVPGERIVGKKCVTFNEPFFTGHFPGNPVMPGVLIIEALAQTGAVLVLSQDATDHNMVPVTIVILMLAGRMDVISRK